MNGLDLMTDCVPNWPKDVIGLHDMPYRCNTSFGARHSWSKCKINWNF